MGLGGLLPGGADVRVATDEFVAGPIDRVGWPEPTREGGLAEPDRDVAFLGILGWATNLAGRTVVSGSWYGPARESRLRCSSASGTSLAPEKNKKKKKNPKPWVVTRLLISPARVSAFALRE